MQQLSPVVFCFNVELAENEGFFYVMFLFILEGLMFSILTVHIDLKETVAQISKNSADHVIEKSPKQNSTILYSRRVFLAVCFAHYFIWFVRAVN